MTSRLELSGSGTGPGTSGATEGAGVPRRSARVPLQALAPDLSFQPMQALRDSSGAPHVGGLG